MTLATAARTLPDDQRSRYERAVLEGRAVAERAVDAALRALDPLPPAIQHALTAFGDDWSRLVEEAAYTQWHRVLFARFLIENELLMNEDAISLSLEDCAEIAHEEGQGEDAWDIAARYASAMLPGIFRPGDPLAVLRLAAEHRAEMQRIVAAMPKIIFTTSDSLGWSYQYWQRNRKDEVNRSEVKIGGAELPAVTQLFTEPYMVDFLVHNTLGAWWATRHPDSPLVAQMEYLRRDENGVPYAGTFDEWPDTVAEVTAIDPCCGSGHFLTTMFHWLRLMRQEEEGLNAADAGDAVLRENLFGLELDARCIQIAHFNLAMHAWLEGGYRALPAMNLACTGIPVKGTLGDWLLLAKGDTRIEEALTKLHKLLENAEHLGSLINPDREVGGDLLTADLNEVMPVLEQALVQGAESLEEDVYGTDVLDAWNAVRLLAARYLLVLTNPPYLGLEKQSEVVADYAKQRYGTARRELAIVFLERMLQFSSRRGTVGAVLPGDWTHTRSNRHYRVDLLERVQFRALARLGANAFASGVRASPILVVLDERNASTPAWYSDVTTLDYALKGHGLVASEWIEHSQEGWSRSPDSRIGFESLSEGVQTIADIADARNGMSAGDGDRFEREFWELPDLDDDWEFLHSSPDSSGFMRGQHKVVYWQQEAGVMAALAESVKHLNHAAQNWRRGKPLWGKQGILLSKIGAKTAFYTGERYDSGCLVIAPNDPRDVLPLYEYARSGELKREIGKLNPAWQLGSPAVLLQLPWDKNRWHRDAAVEFPEGVPPIEACDPDCWSFHGRLNVSSQPLHIAVARLLGYRWPAQFDDDGEPIRDDLDPLADTDGIVCLPSVNGEHAASDRLRALLAAAFGDEWSDAKQAGLLAEVEFAGKSLNDWLRAKKGFAAQHNKLFLNRPFVWQITDGTKDGFSALVNYHKLDRANLDRLIHTYLQDWITNQQAALERGERGADVRVAKALELKSKLEAIAQGTPPYDVYVRWKRDYYLSLTSPPSWDPDLDDGVRMNIRPFVKAGVLHAVPNVNWKKDRGKDPDGSERHNDLYFGGYAIDESPAVGSGGL